MLIIVSDSSVIIDLAKVGLIESAFSLPYDFVMPDVMFADELIDLGAYSHNQLLEAGLTIGELDSDGVGLAFQYAANYHKVGEKDCFALALAKVLSEDKETALLTGDAKLKEAADSEDIEAHGLLWVCDEMNDHGTVERQVLHDALVFLDKDPFVRLPRVEVRKRILRLRRK